jgi:hypothetical protein
MVRNKHILLVTLRERDVPVRSRCILLLFTLSGVITPLLFSKRPKKGKFQNKTIQMLFSIEVGSHDFCGSYAGGIAMTNEKEIKLH